MKTSKAKTPRAAKAKEAKSTPVNGIHPIAENSMESTILSAGLEVIAGSAISAAAPIVPTLEQVRMRAYELYLERGATPGGELHDWIRAERELSETRARP